MCCILVATLVSSFTPEERRMVRRTNRHVAPRDVIVAMPTWRFQMAHVFAAANSRIRVRATIASIALAVPLGYAAPGDISGSRANY
jgi:hypothetical protein